MSIVAFLIIGSYSIFLKLPVLFNLSALFFFFLGFGI